MFKAAPKPIDFQDLQFKLRCRLKVFDNVENANFSQYCNLVACASRFGLIFIGTNVSSMQVIQLQNVEEYTKSDGTKADYPRRNISLPSIPLHLSVNCEHTMLAVVIERNNCCFARFYDVKSFWQQDIIQIGEVQLCTAGVQVREVSWNPALSPIFTACKSDGSLGTYDVKISGIERNELPAAAGANCFCWSPKGKQIAVGSRDGKITQYKPDLKAVKVINAPPLKEPSTLLSLQWVSNYQFIGAFQPTNPDSQTNFIVIDSSKTGDCTYTSYDDICYSNGNTRPMQFYLILIHNWNILMAASSNSMEVGILGNTGEGWTQWILGDSARAELPLTSNHQETLPIGCALDIGSTHPLPWGEATLPPTPLLMLLSHHGILCCFNIIYLKEGIPSICAPPDSITDTSGLQHFITANVQCNTNKSGHFKEMNRTDLQKPPQSTANMENSKASTVSVVSSTPTTIFKAQPSAQTVPQGINFSQNQAMNLFGGQVTLTAVSQSSKSNAQPSLTSKYQFLYPTMTTTESSIGATAPVVQTSTPVLAVNSSIKSVVPTSVTTVTYKSIQPEFGAVVSSKSNQPEVGDSLNKNEMNNIDIKAEEEAEKIFAQMVKEECLFLESELKAVLHQGKSLKLNLGSDDDKTKIIESTRLLEEFFHEVVDICTTQNAEVHILKQNILQSWAWYEEVKSRHLASEDESMMILIRAQPLDSASEKQFSDIRHANYYLESQIAQAHRALDEQWESFQDYCKKKHKIQIPTMEMIFQTMVKQSAILKKQSYILKDIASRVKSKSRSVFYQPLLISVEDHKNLTSELKRLRMNPEDICQIHYEHVINRMKHFTQKKSDALRSFLKKREYSHVQALKPQLSSSIIQTSPSSKLKQSSLLAPKTPFTLKDHLPKKLEFVQSTPKPVVERVEVLSSAVPPTTPIEGLQNFALKFEAKNFSTLPEKTFTPLTKSVISGSPNSAFVSTFGNNPSISTSTTSSFKPTFSGVSPQAPPTTSSSFLKSPPSYTVTTTTVEKIQPFVTISTNALSKPVSFASSTPTTSLQANVTTASKINTNLFSTATTKSSFSFNFQNIPSTTPASFGTSSVVKNLLPSTSASGVTMTKIASSTAPGITPSVKFTAVGDTSVSAKPSSNFSFASTTSATVAVAPFSFSTSGIFGVTNQKPVETSASNAITKPFVFSSKTSTPVTKSNTLMATANRVNTPATSQAVSSSMPTTSTVVSTKITTQSSVFTTSIVTITPKVTTQVISTAVSSPAVFTSAQTNVPSLTGASAATTSVESLVFNTSITSSTQSSVFPVGGIKSVSEPQTSKSVTSTVGSVAICSTTTTESTTVISTIPTTKATSTSAAVAGIFSNQTATSTSQQSIFGSVFNTPSTQSVSSTPSSGFLFGSASSSKTSIFGGGSDTSVSKPLFGSNLSTTASTVSFGTSTTQSSIFGNALSSTSTSSVFGGGPSTAVSTAGFGTPTAVTTKSSPLGSVTSSMSAQSVFGGATSTTTSTAAFGASPVSTTQSTIFGGTVSSTTPVFGVATPSTTQTVFGSSNQTSLFASAVSSTTPQSIFGNPPTTTSQGFGIFGDVSQKTSIFGSGPPTSSTQSSVFGNSSPSIFGNATSASSSVFPQSQTSNTFGQQSVFGSTGSSFGGSGIFGTATPSFPQSSSSIFGNAPTTGSGSIFGGTTTVGGTFGSNTSVFGTPVSSTSSPFGSSNAFSSPTTQNSFSASANTGSFGFGGLSVGSTATTTSAFGASPAPNPFGGDNKSIFGSSSPSSTGAVFGSNTGSVFGNSSQSFGGGNFGSQSPPFGQPSTFSQNSFGSGTFSQQPSGPFSSGSATVGQAGFGASSTFQKPSGFGSPPVFGGSPTFGSAPSFGGAPTFGSPPPFGTTPKMFGSSTSAFGSSSNTQNTAFGNLASQQTVGFGNLAQQAANAPSSNAPFSGNSSFSSWR